MYKIVEFVVRSLNDESIRKSKGQMPCVRSFLNVNRTCKMRGCRANVAKAMRFRVRILFVVLFSRVTARTCCVLPFLPLSPFLSFSLPLFAFLECYFRDLLRVSNLPKFLINLSNSLRKYFIYIYI